MRLRSSFLVATALLLVGCGGSSRYGTGNPISGYTDCDILEAQNPGNSICDIPAAQAAAKG